MTCYRQHEYVFTDEAVQPSCTYGIISTAFIIYTSYCHKLNFQFYQIRLLEPSSAQLACHAVGQAASAGSIPIGHEPCVSRHADVSIGRTILGPSVNCTDLLGHAFPAQIANAHFFFLHGRCAATVEAHWPSTQPRPVKSGRPAPLSSGEYMIDLASNLKFADYLKKS